METEMPTCPITPDAAAIATSVAVRTGEICGACWGPLEAGELYELLHDGRPTGERLCRACDAAWRAQRAKLPLKT